MVVTATSAYCDHVNLPSMKPESSERDSFHYYYGFYPEEGCDAASAHYLIPKIIEQFNASQPVSGSDTAAWDAAVEEVLDSLALDVKIPVDQFFAFIQENYVLPDTAESLIRNCILYAKSNAKTDDSLRYILGILLQDPIEEQDIKRVVFRA